MKYDNNYAAIANALPTLPLFLHLSLFLQDILDTGH